MDEIKDTLDLAIMLGIISQAGAGLRLFLKTVKSRKCRALMECRSFIITIWRSWSILENRYMRQGWYERNRGNLST